MKYILQIIVLGFISLSYAQDGRYEVELAEFNSEVSDFGPSYTEEGLIFASERDSSSLANRRHKINGKLRPFHQLFSVEKEGDSIVSRLKNEVNKKYHESTVALTNDGNTMYFTRNNYYHRKFKKDTNNINLLKIFKSTKLENGRWGNVEELPFNNDNYSVAHPSLNADNTKMYFASDMPGTMGKSDIWYVDIKADGSYGEPVNMGSTINTSGSDTFPFMAKSGDLYFSSDAHAGNGGLDLFVAKVSQEYSQIHNLGSGLNTEYDDFALIFNEEDKTGYFTSNRVDGVGDDDIYKFKELTPLVLEFEVKGIVVEEETQEPIENVTLNLKDEEGNIVVQATSDSEGKYKITYKSDKKLVLSPIKDSLVFKEEKVPYQQNSVIDFKVTIPKVETSESMTIDELIEAQNPSLITDGMQLNIENILFDYNKSNIRTDASMILNKLVMFLNAYPDVKIKINSHTDSRGSDYYNKGLSNRRAKSTINYLKNKGISLNRIQEFIGFGESKLLNNCLNEASCSEQEHQINRRSEFIVVSK